MKKRCRVCAFLIAVLVMPFTVCGAAGLEGNTISSEYLTKNILSNYTVSESTANSTSLDIKATSVILMEPITGTVLYENNKDERLAPASVTKIMSLLLIMEAIDNEKISLTTKATGSAHAAGMGGSQIWLKENETMTVDELLRASVIASANDATVALAEAVCGSEETFVEQMNKRASELGLKNTHFINCCGLDADGHYTSSYDIAVMSSELLKHSLIKKYSTVWMDALRDGKSELVNTNKLIRYYSGATGLKTGTTSKAGCCVSATAERNGMQLVAVVMKAENSNERFSGAKKLLDYGFANYSFCKVEANPELLKSVSVKGGMSDSCLTDSGDGVNLLLKKGKNEEIKQTAEIPDTVEAPVKIGQGLGKIILTLDGKKVGEIQITAADNVEKLTFISALGRMVFALLSPR